MFMIAGQISDNNYAKNAGQTWNGIHTSYPENPKWVGSSLQEGIFNTTPKPGASLTTQDTVTTSKKIGDTNHYFHKASDTLQTIDDTNVIKTMEDWWLEIKHNSRRDQLSFNYIAWKNNFNFEYLKGDSRKNEYFLQTGRHKKRK